MVFVVIQGVSPPIQCWSDPRCGRIITVERLGRPCARVDQWDGLQIRWACPVVGSNPTAAFSLQGAAFRGASLRNSLIFKASFGGSEPTSSQASIASLP